MLWMMDSWCRRISLAIVFSSVKVVRPSSCRHANRSSDYCRSQRRSAKTAFFRSINVRSRARKESSTNVVIFVIREDSWSLRDRRWAIACSYTDFFSFIVMSSNDISSFIWSSVVFVVFPISSIVYPFPASEIAQREHTIIFSGYLPICCSPPEIIMYFPCKYIWI